MALNTLRPRAVVAAEDTVYVVPEWSGNRTTILNETETVNRGLGQLVPDAFDPPFSVNPILTRPELNGGGLLFGWYIPNAGRIVFDSEYPGVVPTLPDEDVIALDVGDHTASVVATGVGTILLDLAVDPGSGELWVAGTEAGNRTRFEPNLTGSAIENRLTVIDPDTGTPAVVALEPPAFPRAYAQPVALAFTGGDDSRVIAAALGSDRLVVLDAAQRAFVAEIPTGSLPSGLAVDRVRGLLYVLCRGDKTLRVHSLDAGYPLRSPPRAVLRPGTAAPRARPAPALRRRGDLGIRQRVDVLRLVPRVRPSRPDGLEPGQPRGQLRVLLPRRADGLRQLSRPGRDGHPDADPAPDEGADGHPVPPRPPGPGHQRRHTPALARRSPGHPDVPPGVRGAPRRDRHLPDRDAGVRDVPPLAAIRSRTPTDRAIACTRAWPPPGPASSA